MVKILLFISGLLAVLTACTPAPNGLSGERVIEVPQASATPRDAKKRASFALTLWYPAASAENAANLRIGPWWRPLFEPGRVARNAALAPGVKHPLVVLLHGFGGSARQMAWLGTVLARNGYIVAAPTHPGNNAIDPMTEAGAGLWWLRAEDARAAIDAVLADGELGPATDPSRIGVLGYSVGGAAAAILAGARPGMARFDAFCASPEGDATCGPQQEGGPDAAHIRAALAADAALAAAFADAGRDRGDPRVKAAFMLAPALGQALDEASLAALRLPVTVLAARQDTVAPAPTNAVAIAALIQNARLEFVPAGHYTFLSECGWGGRWSLPALCIDPDGVDRKALHEDVVVRVIRFFDRALGPR